MKKILKGILIGTLVLCSVVVASMVVGFLLLPHPSSFFSEKMVDASTASESVDGSDKKERVHATSSNETDYPSDLGAEPEFATEGVDYYKTTKEEFDQMVEDLRPGNPPFKVCKNLSIANKERIMFESFHDAFCSNRADFEMKIDDPMAKSVNGVLNIAFRGPKSRELLIELVEHDVTHQGDLLNDLKYKAKFYSQVPDVIKELLNRGKEITQATDNAYLLFNLAKAVAVKPELANDSRVLSYCHSLEDASNAGQEISFKDEMANLAHLLDEQGINHDEIGFDPHYKTSFKIGSEEDPFPSVWVSHYLHFKGSSDKPSRPCASKY